MKLVVLVPSPEYMNYAGARIRYQRIAIELAKRGIHLELQRINDFVPDRSDADILVVSKCHDPLSLVAVATMAARGKLIGVDLFDDYFSQAGDARMFRFRNWLKQILPACDFVLCSTDAMADVAASYRPGIVAHVMNDPAADFRLQELPRILERKLQDAREELTIKVAWFGVGDNPHFPVGLHDLASLGGMLNDLGGGGMEVKLHVLTNPRALTADGLARLNDLPVPALVGEWSEAAEEELLATSFVAFLPVNNQPFSTAKSLNRAITALTAGCQVLSAGYPLYDKLDPLIYRDAAALLSDLRKRTMRLSAGRLGLYRELMEKFASAEAEASRLAQFLSGLQHTNPEDGTLVLLHGHSTSGAAHKMVQAMNGLSVASPYCSAQLGFDVIFKATADGLVMRVSEKAAKRLQGRRGDPTSAVEVSGHRCIELGHNGAASRANGAPTALEDVPLSVQLATYSTWLEEMRMRITAAFGPCRFIVAENSQLPFSLTC